MRVTRAVLSQLEVTMRWPSGENAALVTGAVWPYTVTSGCPLAVSHTRVVESRPAVTIRSPSRENAALKTASNVCFHMDDLVSEAVKNQPNSLAIGHEVSEGRG